jgi:hypothetical protein
MTDDQIAIAWDAARASNRENWEDRVPLHEKAYAISGLDDPDHLSSVVRTDLVALAPFLPDGTTGNNPSSLRARATPKTRTPSRHHR